MRKLLAMSQWFERKFDFNFSADQYPNVCIRLGGAPARLEEIAQSGKLTEKPGGKWSAQEHAGHLLDMEPLWIARVEDFLGEGQTLTPADLTNRKTHEANHNAKDIREILAGFRKARLALCARVVGLEPTRTLLHPRLQQPMRLIDHLYFVAEHDDHHLAQIHSLVG